MCSNARHNFVSEEINVHSGKVRILQRNGKSSLNLSVFALSKPIKSLFILSKNIYIQFWQCLEELLYKCF